MSGAPAPYLVGIAGPSGSGKTMLAETLARRLPSPAFVLGLDAYYRDLSGLPMAARAQTNFDVPEALDRDLLAAQLTALARGEAIEKPTYDFTNHTRREEIERVVPGPFVVVEGLFAFFWQEVREVFATKVFLIAEPHVCLARREARDVRERGRTPESVRAQFMEVTYPMFQEHVWPTRHYADLILHSAAPVELLADSVQNHLARKGVCA